MLAGLCPTLATISEQSGALDRTNIQLPGNNLPIRSHYSRARSNWLAPPAVRETIDLFERVERGGPQSIAAPGKRRRARSFVAHHSCV